MNLTDGWPGFDGVRILAEYLSAEQYQKSCDQIWSVDRRSTQKTNKMAPAHGAVVYAKRDHSPALLSALKKNRSRIVLVTAESDDAVEEGAAIPPQLAGWFSTNSCHSGVLALPLGLGNSYCEVTPKADLIAAFSNTLKTELLYINFRPETHQLVRGPLWESYADASRSGEITRHAGNVSREEYVRTLASHRFMLCPKGNGIDTHRMWEALYLGAIPIVERHSSLAQFSDLPILFVDRLEGLEPSFLESKHQEMLSKRWNWEKLFIPWWLKRFQEKGAMIGGRVSWGRYWNGRFR